jgi:hypothetical protein
VRPRLAIALLLASAAPAAAAPGWTALPRAPQARSEVAAAATGDRIAVLGGFLPDRSSSARVDVYDTATRRWSRLPDLPLRLNHAMAAASGGLLYVAGGDTEAGPASRRAFVMGRDARWRELPRMPAPRAAGGAAVVGGRLYVMGGVRLGSGDLATRAFVGGEGPAGTYPQAEAYDPAARRWRSLPSSPAPRHGLGVAGVRGRIYVLLGGPTPGLSVSHVALALTPR